MERESLKLKEIYRTVEVFPKSIVEWWLVPIKTGEFDDLHCYVKDKKTGKTHSEMGMVGTIIVY